MQPLEVTNYDFRENRTFKCYEHLITVLPAFGEWLTNPGNSSMLDNVIKQVTDFLKWLSSN